MPRTPKERQKGLQYSAILHALLLAITIFGLPLFFTPADDQPSAITVEILPISAVSNVRPSQASPAKEKDPEQKRKDAPKKDPTPPVEKVPEKPTPKVKTSEPEPEPEPEPIPEEKVEKKQPEKIKPEDKKKKEKKNETQDDLAAVLKAVQQDASEQSESKEDAPRDASQSPSKSDNYNPDLPLSISELDLIKSQLARCWNLGASAGSKDAYTLVVHIEAKFSADGAVVPGSVVLAFQDKFRYGAEPNFRAAADSAIRAVYKCSPLKNLPPDKFGTWGEMDITFDPKEMLF